MRARILVQWSHFDGHEVYLPSTHMPPHTARLARETQYGSPIGGLVLLPYVPHVVFCRLSPDRSRFHSRYLEWSGPIMPRHYRDTWGCMLAKYPMSCGLSYHTIGRLDGLHTDFFRFHGQVIVSVFHLLHLSCDAMPSQKPQSVFLLPVDNCRAYLAYHIKFHKMWRERVSKEGKMHLLMFHLLSLVKQIHHHLGLPFLLVHVAWVSIV